MVRWHHVRCPGCGFQFAGGHDHHARSEAFLCLDCIAVYELVTENEFGATPNELVPIFRRIEIKRRFFRSRMERVPMNAEALAVPGEVDFMGRLVTEAVAYDLRGFRCVCGAANFTFEFAKGAQCPSCKKAVLQVSDVIY